MGADDTAEEEQNMTMHYTPQEQGWLNQRMAENAQGGFAGSIELFMCSDGNYRSYEAKACFDEARRKWLLEYGCP